MPDEDVEILSDSWHGSAISRQKTAFWAEIRESQFNFSEWTVSMSGNLDLVLCDEFENFLEDFAHGRNYT